nr:hypothetical protein [Deltaproteobacteria bacterium]
VVLGAMLPDFASMCGGRLAAQPDPTLATGVDLHQRTDGVFHALAPVQALMRELDGRLEQGGCARGPRKAVAHIGIELLLDGVLVDHAPYRASFLAGVADDTPVEWLAPDGAERFAVLRARLRSYGVPDDLRRPDAITYRLSRALAGRPRLAPSSSDLTAIGSALVDQQPRVAIAADTVMRALRATGTL